LLGSEKEWRCPTTKRLQYVSIGLRIRRREEEKEKREKNNSNYVYVCVCNNEGLRQSYSQKEK